MPYLRLNGLRFHYYHLDDYTELGMRPLMERVLSRREILNA